MPVSLTAVLIFSFLKLALSAQPAAPEECPKTRRDWQTYVEDTAEDLTILLPEDPRALPRPERANSVLTHIAKCEKEWGNRMGENLLPPIRACTSRLKRFVRRASGFKEGPLDSLVNKSHGMLPEKLRSLLQKQSRSLGFNTTDQNYYAAVDSYVSVPEDLQDAEFLRNVSNPWKNDGLKKAQAYLDELNKKRVAAKQDPIVHFHFGTRLGNFEAGQKTDAGRLFIRYPGNPTKYLQFATHESGGSGQTSVVAVYKDKKGTLHTYIKDHFRDIKDDGSATLKKVTEGVFKGNACINCHQSGPRALAPSDWGSLSEDTRAKIKMINAEFASMTGMEWGGFYDVASMDLGPPLGSDEESVQAERTDAFFDKCTKERLESAEKYDKKVNVPELRKNKAEVYAKLRTAMNCSGCHNGSDRGPIKLPFDRNHTFGKIFSGEMPPGNKLAPIESNLLEACLKQEFFGYWDSEAAKRVPGTLQRYMAGVSCLPGTTSGEGGEAEEKVHQPQKQ